MRKLCGAAALLAILALCGCENNPLEAWAYSSVSGSAPEQGQVRQPARSSPGAAAAGAATVTTAPIRSMTLP